MDNSALLLKNLFADLQEQKEFFYTIRHHLHKYPELSNHENNTASYLSSVLNDFGITHQMEIAGENGVIGIIEGSFEGPTIALRADMDALPIKEETGLPFASVNPNIMHACGHDFHMAAVLATGILLNKHKNLLGGKIKLIFQPAEENGPIGGARNMIAAGALENPNVDAIFGCHVFPSLPKRSIWIPEGPVMAAVDNFIIEITGKGGHAAMPHEAIDPVPISAHLILALHNLISKKVPSQEPAVVSIGKIEGGNRRNIIPDTVILEGTMRTISPESRNTLQESINVLVKLIPASMMATASIQWFKSYDVTINNPAMAKLARDAISEFSTTDFVVEKGVPQMTSEDFSYFLQSAPGAFFLIGTGEGNVAPLHSNNLKIVDEVLDDMIMSFISVVIKALFQI
jgi:amidohydrolase